MRVKPHYRAHEFGAQVVHPSRPASREHSPVPPLKRKAPDNDDASASAATKGSPLQKLSCCEKSEAAVAEQSSVDAARILGSKQDSRTVGHRTQRSQHDVNQVTKHGPDSDAGHDDEQNTDTSDHSEGSELPVAEQQERAVDRQTDNTADVCAGSLNTYRHASGSAKKVTVAPDGSCSVPLEHKLSHQPTTPRPGTTWNNFWLHIPSNLARQCFKDAPCDVEVLITIDDKKYQAAEGTGERYPVKASVKKRPGRSEYYMAGCSPLLAQYHEHLVTSLTVNSSSDQITLHLQSPEQQRAAAAGEQQQLTAAVSAARADAVASGIAGWQECKGTKKVVNGGVKRSLLRIPAVLVSRVFPTPLPQKFKVQLSIYKDNQLIGVRPDATLTPDRAVGSSSYSVLLNEFLQQQLAGCAVVCHRAAPPAHLQVCFSSASSALPATQASLQQDNRGSDDSKANAAACDAYAAAADDSLAARATAETQQQQQQVLQQVQSSEQPEPRAAEHIQTDQGHDKEVLCRWFPWAGKQEPLKAAAVPATLAISSSGSVQSVTGSMNRLGGIQRHAGMLAAGESVVVKRQVSC